MSEPLTYRDAGVDIDAGNELVSKLKNIVKATHRPGVLGGIGGFAGCFEISQYSYQRPVLVASTDGVGTKLRFAIQCANHDTIGIDLVAMCVNDLVVMGAEPLFFLDYYATSKLEVAVAAAVIKGIATGCQQANIALLGGETAEMPGIYSKKDYDLAGFCVGIIEKDHIIDGSQIVPGDVLVALPSSGPHANGFSLIHHLIETKGISLDLLIENQPLSQILLTPTRIYVKSLLALARNNLLKGAAHITGGGFIDNIPRILPADCAAMIDCGSWQLPPIFNWLQSEGKLSHFELRRTFNCGVGMVLCIAKNNLPQALELLQQNGEKPWILGEVISKQKTATAVVFSDGN